MTQESDGSAAAPGWYSDPSRRHELRYWDGVTWTQHVANGDRRSVDVPPPAPTGNPAQGAMVAAIVLALVFGVFGLNRASGKLVSTSWDTANLVRDILCVVGWTVVAVGLYRRQFWAATVGAVLGLALVVYSLAFVAQAPTNPFVWVVSAGFAAVFGAVGLGMFRLRSGQL